MADIQVRNRSLFRVQALQALDGCIDAELDIRQA